MQRYFISEEKLVIDQVTIDNGDYHHIKNVMRMKTGDRVYICVANKKTYIAAITTFTDEEVILKIVEEVKDIVEMPLDITIAQGIVRREKTEEVIKRITELGATKYQPVIMERSIIKINEKENRRNERYQLIAKEASEQSHRTRITEINNCIRFDELLKLRVKYDLCLYAYEESGRKNCSTFKEEIKKFTGKSILVLVGPEGGISPKEVSLLEENGFIAIGLGPRILRTETAPLYIMSAISYEIELGEKNEN